MGETFAQFVERRQGLKFYSFCGDELLCGPLAPQPRSAQARSAGMDEWNDHIFRAEVRKAAAKVGKSPSGVLKECGISRATFSNKPPEHARRLDILIKLMGPLNWQPADVLYVIARSFEWKLDLKEALRLTLALAERDKP